MKPIQLLSFLLLSCFVLSCSGSDDSTDDDVQPAEGIYFPPLNSDTWETKTIEELGWNATELQPLLDFLEDKNSKSFIMLHNGKIVEEHYFNNHTNATSWYWASAGKTLTTALSGIAQDQGLININDKVSDYLGTGWTNAALEKENLLRAPTYYL